MTEHTSHHLCHNPACRKPVARRDAFLRSVSLTRVAFCSALCVAMFDELDAANGHHVIPVQRSAADESMAS